jgi:hypothetical protein
MNKVLKGFINVTLLAISITVSSYVLLQMSPKFFIQAVISVTILVYETLMQLVFATGKALWRVGTALAITGAIVCFILFTAYVFCYAVPTGIEFFAQQIAQQEAKAEILDDSYDTLKGMADTTLDSLKAYNEQMKKEAETGYGSRSKVITEEQNKLYDRVDILIEKLNEVSDRRVKTKLNLFYGLSKYLQPIIKVSPETLTFIMFMVLFLTIYLGLIVTSWDIKFSESSTKVLKSSTKVLRSSKKVLKSSEEVSKSFEEVSKSSGEVLDKEAQEFLKFVNASIRDTLRVNSPRRVAKLTGIPEDRCKTYRAFLDSLGIIETVQGGSRVKYPKEVVLEKVQKTLQGVIG